MIPPERLFLGEFHFWPTQNQFSPSALKNMRASRQVIETVLHSGQIVYGVNTGFGALSNKRISDQELEQLQINLVRSHAVGTGPVLDPPIVRAMMLLRANTLAKGFSGVRPEVVSLLLDLLNHNITPVIPSQGSLGASGDLAPLAHLALVLMGEGEAVVNGKPMSGAKALKTAGLEPIVLEAKEGLALLNGTQMMTALGILTLLEAEQLSDVADLAGAMTVEAVKGSHQPFDARIAQVREHSGHAESAKRIRGFLKNSAIAQSHIDCDRVQDAYSLRCIPQVHGTVRDVLKQVRKTLEIEANAATDNPLVFPDGAILAQGNFHGEPVALALDMLAIALSELSSISERRIDKLMNPVFSNLPPFLNATTEQAGLHSGLMMVHYTAASLVSENKLLAQPACVDSIPTSNDKEDHVSMGATAARKAARVLTHTRWVLAAELLCASQGLDLLKPLKPGHGVFKAKQAIRKLTPFVSSDRSLASDIDRLANHLAKETSWLF